MTGNLNLDNLDAVSVFRSGSTKVVLVGGATGLYRTLNPDSGSNTTWTKFSANLPNAPVSDIHYYPNNAGSGNGDALLVGTFGRGAWLLQGAGAQITAPAILTIDGTDGNDVIRLVRDADNPLLLDVYVNSATPTEQVPFASVDKIQVNGSAATTTSSSITPMASRSPRAD